MIDLTNFDLELIVLFKLLTKGHDGGKIVVKLTEIAYTPLYTSMYLLAYQVSSNSETVI